MTLGEGVLREKSLALARPFAPDFVFPFTEHNEMARTIEALRTPEACFENLPNFAYRPHYIDDLDGFAGLRLHYVDERPSSPVANTQTFLCLHGEPSWSYLYRKMAPVFLGAGHRVVAPDFFGFGKSDKPIDDAVYNFAFHRNTLLRFIERLDLSNVTLVVQDWGGLLGLTLPMEFPQRIRRLLVMNTTLARGISPGPGFDAWKAFMRTRPDVDVAALMRRSTPQLTEAEAAAYGAPFPDQRYKAGVRRFPELVMVSPEMDGAEISLKAARWLATEWSGQSFMAVGMKDPVLGPSVMAELRTQIRNCPAPLEIPEGGHFVQEWGEEIARAAFRAFSN